jgi:hypothetical protein
MNERCEGKVGSSPWWMGTYQIDPCRCVLVNGHDGECQCEHTANQQVPGGDQS